MRRRRRRAAPERRAQRTGLKMRARAAILFASTFLVFFFFSEARMDEMSAAACSTLACSPAQVNRRRRPLSTIWLRRRTQTCIQRLPSIAWQRFPAQRFPALLPVALSSSQIGLFGQQPCQLGLAELQQAWARGHAGLGHALGEHAQAQLTDSAFAFNTSKSMGADIE